MAFQIPTREPSTLIAGTSWMWNKTLADYPPSEGWSLTYYLTGHSSFQFGATPDLTNGFYAVNVPATGDGNNAAVAAGPYRWTAVVALAGETHAVAFGDLTVEPNPNLANGTDARSHAETMLAAIEAELEARATGGSSSVLSYAIDGRSITKMSQTELYSLRGKYAWEVAAQTNGGKPAPVVIQFGSPHRRSQAVGPNGQWDQ